MPVPDAPTHACVRCGKPVPIDVGLCEDCNPLGLRDTAASQVHGTVFIMIIVGFVLLAFVGRLAISGVGPFTGSITDVVPASGGLAISLTVDNGGSSAGATTCRITDPNDRNGGTGAIVVSPQIAAHASASFTQTVTELGTVARPLVVACTSP